jgi:hypothetical protein
MGTGSAGWLTDAALRDEDRERHDAYLADDAETDARFCLFCRTALTIVAAAGAAGLAIGVFLQNYQ